jgi:hypothetical protein
MKINRYLITFSTSRGSESREIAAFNKPQAKRKLMSQLSTKYDLPKIKSIEEIG